MRRLRKIALTILGITVAAVLVNSLLASLWERRQRSAVTPSPPTATDFSHHPLKRVRANGLDFAYLEAGRGPLVLLLHGFPDSADTWNETLDRLAQHGYRGVAPFMRGYYPTAIPPDGDYSAATLGRDALALIEALGETRADVVGHDWGASTAYAAANLDPGRVRRLVTLAIPHPRVLNADLALFRKAPHFIVFQFGYLSEWYASRNDYAYIDYLYAYWSPNWVVPQRQSRLVKASFAQPGRMRAALGYYRALFRDARDTSKAELYRRVTTVPTLAFAGDADGALDTARAFARMPSAFSGGYRLVMLPGAGHFLHREQPREFLDALLAFLQE